MRICFLSSMHPANDKRVFDKEACTLAKAGFEVIHLAPAHDGVIDKCMLHGVKIITFKPFNGLAGRLFGLGGLYRMAGALDADVYHCNEVDSWIVGVALHLLKGRICVFDVHEHYPEEFAEVRFPFWARPVIRNGIAGIMRVLSWFTMRIVLAKKSLEIDFMHMPKGSVHLVRNYVPLDALPEATSETKDSGTLKLIHLGLFNRYRGWSQLLEAMSIAQNQDIELLILGSINDGSVEEFYDTVNTLGLSERVSYKAWVPFEKAMAHVQASDVGVICFQPGLFNHVHALPHKMFDYMGGGLAIIVPEFAVEVVDILEDAQCGYCVNTADPNSIADAIDRLCEDRSMLRVMGSNGRQAVIDKYNWEAEAETLVAMYKELERS